MLCSKTPRARTNLAYRLSACLLSLGMAMAIPGTAIGQSSAKPISTAKLGAVYAFSGPFAIYSATIKNGLEMALDELNAQGDPKIELIMEDDRSTKDDAINVYQKFIQRDKVMMIFGPLIGGQVFAAGPLAQRAQTPVMLTSVATPGVTGIGDYIFRTSVESSTVIPFTVTAAKRLLDIKKAAQIYTNDDQFSVGEYQAFAASLKAEGVEIVGVETVRTGDVDFSAQLTKIRSLNPDTLVISSQGQEAVGIMTQARKLGLENIRFIGGNSLNSSGVVKDAGQAMEGALSATPWFLEMDNAKNLEFVKRYRERFSSDPDWLAAQTYDAMYLVKQAIKEANIAESDDLKTSRRKLRDALAAIKTFDGVLGQITFDENRDPHVAGAVITVKNGKHVLAE